VVHGRSEVGRAWALNENGLSHMSKALTLLITEAKQIERVPGLLVRNTFSPRQRSARDPVRPRFSP
jgi:hypothetical protein